MQQKMSMPAEEQNYLNFASNSILLSLSPFLSHSHSFLLLNVIVAKLLPSLPTFSRKHEFDQMILIALSKRNKCTRRIKVACHELTVAVQTMVTRDLK